HAADRAGTYIPHFCYHKKLSIAANCRMCLVEVEKAPKPMPACATPATQGMIVRTRSEKALKAQQSVMEFLLINHPLDCPICDQGGECQLQDLAVGYGASESRYTEEKRVVFRKEVGPLISMAEMTRCIHCTRCVRFGQEVAGVMELGMIHRGEHAEITTVIGDTIDSELSGNMIDICPVGALTSKPFRYSARTWELSRRKSVSPHDSNGSNLIVQVKSNRVMRVLPLENEAVNECWIADRDRFSYEALNVEDRLTMPMVKQNGEWQSTDWPSALEYVSRSLGQIKDQHGASSIGALASPYSTVEELHLLGKLLRGLGSENIDHRLRNRDFSAAPAGSARWLGGPIAELSTAQRVLVVGSFLRKDHPLFAQRLRQACKHGAQIHRLNAFEDDWLMPIGTSLIAEPARWLNELAGIAAALAATAGLAAPVAAEASDQAKAVAQSLASGEGKWILLGKAAAEHPQADALLALADWIATQTGARVGFLGEAANSVGAQLVNALPGEGGRDARSMLDGSLKALLLLNVEPMLDIDDAPSTLRALSGADLVVALTPFKSAAIEVADVLLPIAPFTETSGSFVSVEGRLQSFHGVVKALGDSRPAWKTLRVLGNLLGLPGFEFETSDEVRTEAIGDPDSIVGRFDNRPATAVASIQLAAIDASAIERIADLPIYASDMLVRRADSLQRTVDGQPTLASISPGLAAELGVSAGALLRFSRGADAVVELPVTIDNRLAPRAARIPAGLSVTASLGAAFGPLGVEKV
ncbi:MAG: NADH-quinone oxidoreductase subunit NuoG, partial [Ideonella sp.]